MNSKNDAKHWKLYVLKLEDKKFYVGITSKNPEARMQEHINRTRGAYWTAKHAPVKIIYTEDLGFIRKSLAEKRENQMTRALMQQRGLNNVRGGDLTSVKEYTKRFGYIWDKFEWHTMTVVVLLTLINLALFLDKYL